MSEQSSVTHGAVEECVPSNGRVPGSTPGESEQFVAESPKSPKLQSETLLPQLRHLDQTPITPSDKKVAKRTFEALSPVQENDLSDEIMKKIEGTLMSSIRNALPMIIENVMVELQCTFKSFIDTAIETAIDTAKGEIFSKVHQDLQYMDMKSELTAKCEAEQLETYNRRDNIKILQLREDVNENGNFVGENMEHTMQKVLQLSQKLDAKIDEKDISIAHRLPTRKGNIRPIIVKFSRRVAKVELLRKKKILFENKSEIKVFEDVSRPRVLFMNMMRQDSRINSVHTKDGVILYTMKNDNQVYKINNLLNGAYDLDYPLLDVTNCFSFR